jgi:hypothetical protein
MPNNARKSKIKALWVVLIDHSGSMGDRFAAHSQFEGYSESGNYRIKLDAAKDMLLKQINSFTAQDVAVVAFTGKANLLFKCPRDQVQVHKEEITNLQPHNGTDISNALGFTFDQVKAWQDYDSVRFLVISDGLSDVESASNAANRCFHDGIFIDTILIDPSPMGLEMAESISLGGRVTAVTSSAELDETLLSERQAYEEDLIQVERQKSAQMKEAKKESLTGTATLFVAIATFLSLLFGIVLGFDNERRLFQLANLIGIILILVGIYLLYRAYEEKEKLPIYISRQQVRMVSVLRTTGKARTMLLIGGWGAMVFGFGTITLGFCCTPDSPFTATATPTSTATTIPTATFSPMPTNTPTATPTLTFTPTPTPSYTPTATLTPTNTLTPTPTSTPTITVTISVIASPTFALTSTASP